MGSSENDTDGRATFATPTYAWEEAARTTRTDGRATLAMPTYAREEAARTTRTDGQPSQRPPMQGRKQRERHGRTGNSRNAHLCKGGSSENDTEGATLATPTYAREEAARTTRTDGQLSQRPPMQGRKQRERHGRTGNSRNAHLCKGGSS